MVYSALIINLDRLERALQKHDLDDFIVDMGRTSQSRWIIRPKYVFFLKMTSRRGELDKILQFGNCSPVINIISVASEEHELSRPYYLQPPHESLFTPGRKNADSLFSVTWY